MEKLEEGQTEKGAKVKESEPEKCFFFIFYFVCFRKTLASHLRSFHGINLNNLFSLVEASEQRKDRKEIIYQMMWQAKQACL